MKNGGKTVGVGGGVGENQNLAFLVYFSCRYIQILLWSVEAIKISKKVITLYFPLPPLKLDGKSLYRKNTNDFRMEFSVEAFFRVKKYESENASVDWARESNSWERKKSLYCDCENCKIIQSEKTNFERFEFSSGRGKNTQQFHRKPNGLEIYFRLFSFHSNSEKEQESEENGEKSLFLTSITSDEMKMQRINSMIFFCSSTASKSPSSQNSSAMW